MIENSFVQGFVDELEKDAGLKQKMLAGLAGIGLCAGASCAPKVAPVATEPIRAAIRLKHPQASPKDVELLTSNVAARSKGKPFDEVYKDIHADPGDALRQRWADERKAKEILQSVERATGIKGDRPPVASVDRRPWVGLKEKK